MAHLDLLTQSYDYKLPQDRIALYPADPPDSAKLLVYDRNKDTLTHTTFRALLEFIPDQTAVFLNDTKVIKARLFGRKQTGGKVEVLLNKPLPNNRYNVMIRGKVRQGSIIEFPNALQAHVLSLESDGSRTVAFFQEKKPIDFETLVTICDSIGHIPLPPYMQRSDTPEDETHYQSLFARQAGAVAAPTASLHFTPQLLTQMRQKHNTYTLTLHIGAGTFKPVESDVITSHPMHSEYFHIPQNAVEVLQSTTPLLAVGTTVTRTIEYFARTKQTQGECDLFLHPLNPPVRVNHLLTNFHLPKSTLIMLVASFVGREKTLRLYQEAINKGYRFYSYGDAMLII